MFFQKMTPAQVKSRDKAHIVSAEFYGWALFIHALYAFFFLSELSATLWILIGGSVVYSVSNFWFSKREKRLSHD